MAHSHLESYTTAHTIAQNVGTVNFEVFKQSRNIIGHTFIAKFTGYVFCTAMALHFRYNYFTVFRKQGDHLGPV
ncbi:hypothetical protein D3C86_1626820 [compost metagenome]